MATFLQLVQDLHREAGISGSPPATVVDQTGEFRNLVGWVASAWTELQLESKYWRFLRKPLSFDLVPGQSVYTPAQMGISPSLPVRAYDDDSMRVYPLADSNGNGTLFTHLEPEIFRERFGLNRVSGGSLFFTDNDDMSITVGPVPDSVQRVQGYYYRTPQLLQVSADVPDMPETFHSVITYKALYKYAMFEAAPEVRGYALRSLRPLVTALYIDQLPDIQPAEGLA